MDRQDWYRIITDGRQSNPVVPADDALHKLVRLPKIKAVVFDVYGTLFSSGVGDISLATEQDRDRSLKSVIEKHGIQLTDEGINVRFDEFLHQIIANHQDDRRQHGVAFPEVEIRDVWAEFITELASREWINPGFEVEIDSLVIQYEALVNPIQPMPGLENVLSGLSGSGIVMSIVSNAQFYTPLLFEAFLGKDLEQLGICADCSVWSYKLLEGKPSVRLYEISAQQLLEHHGIQAKEVLYVGNDMRNDIWPAQKAGYKTALFSGDRLSLRRREDDVDCVNVVPDIELTELEQIQSCI